MDTKKLLDALASPRQEALNRHTEMTILNLARAVQGDQVMRALHEGFIAANYTEMGMKPVFTGNGPKGRLVQQQRAILEYAFAVVRYERLHPHETPLGRIQALAKKFQYHLLSDPISLSGLKDALDVVAHTPSMRDAVMGEIPSLQDAYEGHAIKAKTGLYLDNSQNVIAILRGAVAGGSDVQFMIVVQRQSANLFLHHPMEELWVPCDNDVTLLGLEEGIRYETKLLAARMGILPEEGFNFKAHIDKYMETLRPLLDADALDTVSTYFTRESPLSGRLAIPTQFGQLVFWHTKGDYPMLRWSFVHDLEHMRSINQAQYPDLVWAYVKHQVDRVLTTITRVANKNLSKIKGN